MKDTSEKNIAEADYKIDWAKAKYGKNQPVRLCDIKEDIDTLKEDTDILKRHDDLFLDMIQTRDERIRNLQRWLVGLTSARD